MKILRLKQHLTSDIDFEFEDEEIEYLQTYFDLNFPEVDYEIIEKDG